MTDPTAADAFLLDFHRRHPGCTSQAFADGVTPEGLSTYAVLLQGASVLIKRREHLLDLACGDGFLLARARTAFPDAKLTGIDMSEAELALARACLQGQACDLHRARADALPLPDASVEVITCHMALMLLAPIEPVLAEVRRVLRPGGRLLAVLSGERSHQTGPYAVFLDLLSAVPGFAERAVALGDRRWRQAAGGRTLLGSAGFRLLRHEPLPVAFMLQPGHEWDYFAGMYTDDWLTAAETADLQRQFAAATAGMRRDDGCLPMIVSLTALTATVA